MAIAVAMMVDPGYKFSYGESTDVELRSNIKMPGQLSQPEGAVAGPVAG